MLCVCGAGYVSMLLHASCGMSGTHAPHVRESWCWRVRRNPVWGIGLGNWNPMLACARNLL